MEPEPKLNLTQPDQVCIPSARSKVGFRFYDSRPRPKPVSERITSPLILELLVKWLFRSAVCGPFGSMLHSVLHSFTGLLRSGRLASVPLGSNNTAYTTAATIIIISNNSSGRIIN